MLHENLIINADDFGYSSDINCAITRCFEREYINSTSLMTNMPAAEEAIQLANLGGFRDQIGIHVNFTAGKPLTNFSHPGVISVDGSWNRKWFSPYRTIVSQAIKNALLNEIEAQIQWAIQKGIRPHHLDSHHHVHTAPGIFPIFLAMARRYRLKLRIAQTHYSNSYLKLFYRKVLNGMIRQKGLHNSDFFETLTSFHRAPHKLGEGKVEIMVHPTIGNRNRIIDHFEKNDLQADLVSLSGLVNYKPVHHE